LRTASRVRCERNGMSIRVRARFSNGVLMPLEPLDLEEGREYVITIEYEPVPDRGAEGQPEEPAP